MNIMLTRIRTSESFKARANVAEKIEYEIASISERVNRIEDDILSMDENIDPDDWRLNSYKEELSIKREELSLFKTLLSKL